MTKVRPVAKCHTERPAFAKGLCRKCYDAEYYAANKEAVKRKGRAWANRNPNKMRNAKIKNLYGIDNEIYAARFKAQDGACKICGESKTTILHIDHNHKTGQVRGLLCGNCNRGLGLFKEDIKRLETAIRYLRLWESEHAKP